MSFIKSQEIKMKKLIDQNLECINIMGHEFSKKRKVFMLYFASSRGILSNKSFGVGRGTGRDK